jgi:hypothetical protein
VLRKVIILFSPLLFSGSVFAGEQIITPAPLSQQSAPKKNIHFDVKYATKNPIDGTLGGLGLRLHWDSSALTLRMLPSHVFTVGKLGEGTVEDDTLDFDFDSKTDKFIHIAWLDFAGNWPGSALETLYTAHFTTAASFTKSTSINFSSSSTASGYILSATSAIIHPPASTVSVPTVVGQSQSSAKAQLIQAGLKVGSITTQSSGSIASDHVISQSPISGTPVLVGSDIGLVISSGASSANIPSVTGKTKASAKAQLISAGLTIGSISYIVSDTVAAGHVVSQSLASGSSGSVNLVVSNGSIPIAALYRLLQPALAPASTNHITRRSKTPKSSTSQSVMSNNHNETDKTVEKNNAKDKIKTKIQSLILIKKLLQLARQ